MPRQTALFKPAASKASLESVAAHLASGNLAAALVAIRKLHLASPGEETQSLYRKIINHELRQAIISQNHGDFERYYKTAKTLGDDAEWQFQLAQWLAQHGELPQALMMLPAEAPEAQRQLLVAHTADRCIRLRSYAQLPDEHHDACKNTILAIAKFEKGDDDAARELLQSFNLTSPFLEWKLMLRGLMAFSQNDDVKAIENWTRLSPNRMPLRLIQPLWMKIDPAYRDKFDPRVQNEMQRQAQELCSTKAETLILKLQKSIGRNQMLSNAWPAIEKAWAELKPTHPALAERLACGIQDAVIHQGSPHDLVHYRRIFGSIPDDPDFLRLQALAFENADQLELAVESWEKYERWLAKKPANWPLAELNRARALLLTHIGKLCEEIGVRPTGDDLGDFDIFSQTIQRILAGGGKNKPAKKQKPVAEYYQNAIRLDPSALEPRLQCLEHYLDTENYDGAIALAHETLAVLPENLQVLTTLAEAFASKRQFFNSYATWKRAITLNPLDKKLTLNATVAVEAAARQQLASGDANGALATIEQFLSAVGEEFGTRILALKCTVLQKLGQTEASAVLRGQLMNAEHNRLVMLLLFNVDAQYAKLKAAEKSASTKAFNEAMTKAATVKESLALWLAHESLVANGFDYRGSKSMEKKLETVLQTVPEAFHSDDFRMLMHLLQSLRKPKLVLKIVQGYLARFPDRAMPKLAFAEAQLQGRPNWSQRRNALAMLQYAKQLIEQGRDPDAKDLLPRIEELIESLDFFY